MKLRLKCLKEDKPLKQILTIARTLEIADRQAKSNGTETKLKQHRDTQTPNMQITVIHIQHKENGNRSHNLKKKIRNCSGK